MGKHGGRELAEMKRGLRQGLDLGEWFWEESRKVASTISVKDRIFLDSARMPCTHTPESRIWTGFRSFAGVQ